MLSKNSEDQNSNINIQDNISRIENTHQQLENLVESMGEFLVEVTALEVNTAIVSEIIPSNFIPWETYRDIYLISTPYLEEIHIHPSLHNSYLNLRYKLEVEYFLLLRDSESEFYNPDLIENDTEYVANLSHTPANYELISTKLPSPIDSTNPDNIIKVKQLFKNTHFLHGLRKLGEMKNTLDNQNQRISQESIQATDSDIIYAQTTIGLDGAIVNRYNQQIFSYPRETRELLLQIHEKSVEAGQKQWRGLLGLVWQMVKQILKNSR